MEPIRSIAALPFRERGALELLNLDVHREAPDPDYAGYGFARVEGVGLEQRDGAPMRLVREPLLIAVHSADEPEALSDDIELAFVVPEVAPGYEVSVLLSDFLRIWLPLLLAPPPGQTPAAVRPIVLVVCNPHHARIARPLAAGGAAVHYPAGDVESWLELDAGPAGLRLVADAWLTIEAETPSQTRALDRAQERDQDHG
jgi:hypothetical protein